MFNVLIVDDEAIVRSSLETIVNWNTLGFVLVGSVSTGRAALNIAQTQRVDLVLTDIKMPVMDGLTLIEHLQKLPVPPLAVVLSAYSDFALVRKAFTLGAVDYVVKSDITAPQMETLVVAMQQRIAKRSNVQERGSIVTQETPAQRLKKLALGENSANEAFLSEPYLLACIEIDNFRKESLRFGADLAAELVQPILSFSSQVPRVAAKCILSEISAARYLLHYAGGAGTSIPELVSICTQLQNVIKTTLNLSVTVGISSLAETPSAFWDSLREASENLTCAFIFGQGGIYAPEIANIFSVKEAQRRAPAFSSLLQAMKTGNTAQLSEPQQALFSMLASGGAQPARDTALCVIYETALMMTDAGSSLWEAFNTEGETDFYQRVNRLQTVREVEMWLTNFTRWVTEYTHDANPGQYIDPMEKAKRFITENYASPNLNLAAVASHVALNEKYFSTRFNKTVGMGFAAYITQIRIAMAKQMILKTDMKMYEISDAVGFVNVEHFARVFKKLTGTPPLALRKGK